MQPQSERPTVQQFVALESQVWEAFVAGDAEADSRVLADDIHRSLFDWVHQQSGALRAVAKWTHSATI